MSRISIVAVGILIISALLTVSCVEPTQAGIPPLSWPEGREPEVIPGIGEFQLKAGQPEGDATLLLYYYGLEGTLTPPEGENSETSWENWTRLTGPGVFTASEGSYNLYAVARNAYGDAVRTSKISFVVHSVPKWTVNPGVTVDDAKPNEFILNMAGKAEGVPEPTLEYYYALSGTEAPGDGNDWKDFTKITLGAVVTGVPGGDYILYGLAVTEDFSIKSDEVTFTVNGAPVWDSEPTVDTSKGGQFIVSPGVVQGGPAPTVKYYYAFSNTQAPGDEDWAAAGFTEVTKVDGKTEIIVDPGDYALYGAADNTNGNSPAVRTAKIEFTVVTATLDAPPAPTVHTGTAGEFMVTAVTATGEPTPELKYYYAAKGTVPPADGDWAAFTEITVDVEDGKAIKTGDADYVLYAVAKNSGGSKMSPVASFTVTAADSPVWSTLATVTTGGNEFTITAGDVEGNPIPVVKYYFGVKGETSLGPSGDWANSLYFDEVVPGEAKQVLDGEYDLYGVAVNNADTVVSDVVTFTVEAALKWSSAPLVETTLDEATVIGPNPKGSFKVTESRVQNDSGATIKYYYAADTVPPPEDVDGDWQQFTDVSADILAGNPVTSIDPGDYRLYGTAKNNLGHKVVSPPATFTIDRPVAPGWTTEHSITTPAIANTASYRITPAVVSGMPAPAVTYYRGGHTDNPPWQEGWTETEWTDNGYSKVVANTDIEEFPGNYDIVAVAKNALGILINSKEVTITSGSRLTMIKAPKINTDTGQFTIADVAVVNSDLQNTDFAYYYIEKSLAEKNWYINVSTNPYWRKFEKTFWTIDRQFVVAATSTANIVDAGTYLLYAVVKSGDVVMVSDEVEFDVIN